MQLNAYWLLEQQTLEFDSLFSQSILLLKKIFFLFIIKAFSILLFNNNNNKKRKATIFKIFFIIRLVNT
jgi:hypothetical protein